MATIAGKFVNDSGVTELEGSLVTDQPVNADTVGGVAINNTPSGDAEILITADASNAAWGTLGALADATSGGTKPSVADIPVPRSLTSRLARPASAR
jgi:hypothetical protein